MLLIARSVAGHIVLRPIEPDLYLCDRRRALLLGLAEMSLRTGMVWSLEKR